MTVTTLGYTMVLCGNSDDPQHSYRRRIEKVKFGVPVEEAFAHDIPATLLVLLLKVHKDGPAKKDIWRAPGSQVQVRKLSHIMQHGRLVNIANFSVYTAASVIKKFLSKLPGGIFGLENEQKLFDMYNLSSDLELQRQAFCRVFSSLPIPSQHLLVLLYGTFYMISESADSFGSRMTAEALGISVAPSLFHSCIHDGQRAKMEDVVRFKIASEIISKIIANFGYTNLFPRESYEFYARITGRTVRCDENDSRLRFVAPAILPESYSQSDVVFVSADTTDDRGSLNRNYHRYCRRQGQSTSHHVLSYTRLSSSAAEVQLPHNDEDDEKYLLNAFHVIDILQSSHSLTCLEWVHEKQTRRMRTRSEWFLLPTTSTKDSGCAVNPDYTNDCLMEDDTQKSPQPGTFTSSSPCISEQLPPTTQQPSTTSTSRIGGIVRRRSWRTHYVRPNRSNEDDEKEQNSNVVTVVSSRSAPIHRRYVSHLYSRNVQSIGHPIMPPSSLTDLQQQRSKAPELEYEKLNCLSAASSITSRDKESKTISRFRNVHF